MNWKKLLSPERIRTFQKSTTSRDLRTEFEKDYHRIIGSSAFRRLQDKTQVFPLDKSDYIRTRLTHSLEVSSFARSLGQNVGEKILKENIDSDFTWQSKEDICMILQCAGLIHDIGNPPFGHFGESAIQDWFKNNLGKIDFNGTPVNEVLDQEMLNDFYNFEGNTQALRVVSKLHYLIDEHGMNLTKPLLGTIIKYPVSSSEIDKKSGDIKTKKMGYFLAEKDTFEDIQNSLGTNGCRHPLTFLLEAADDIAYKTADIEDAVKKGCLTFEKLVEEFSVELEVNGPNEFIEKMMEALVQKYEKALRKKKEEPGMYAVQNWLIGMQGNMLFAASDNFIAHYDEIMAGTYKHDLFYQTNVEKMMDMLGDIAYRYAFTSRPIYKLEIAADNIFEFFFNKFVNAIIYYDTDKKLKTVDEKLVSIISQDYKSIYHTFAKNKSEKEKLYLRLLLVTDYICGMTDSFAKNLYQELNGIQ